MSPTLYTVPSGPPSRSVLLTAKLLGLDLDIKTINLQENEHKSPTFLTINPQHCLPTLRDGDFTLWDSHAIMVYLISKYGKNDALYPADINKRAIIDQRLHFDSGVLWVKVVALLGPIVYSGAKTISEANVKAVFEVLDFVEAFLEGHDYAAGDSLTIADLSWWPNIKAILTFVDIEKGTYPNILAWLARLQATPLNSEFVKGQEVFENYFQNLMK